ncbi:hypothetical protein OE88DRAFT_1661173 [Heliocybe sulcata]|uniref:Ig-like domain-containing protein n=1 Tax=Heliocybe sulcata TaxID=5364 RepID=A0A5C3N2I5_9AGAM|nr:hypothetical protein OE88DRAFT_1661173 [Heliocybe sulcata]
MQFSILAAFVVAAVGVQAAPSPAPVAARSVEARAGCGSSGPFGTGHFEWYITASCTSGQQYDCQAMDASGCEPGLTGKIGSLEVDDPNDTTQYAKGSHTNSLAFTCPSSGQVRCQANFEDNNDGPNYSLRIVPA